MLNIKLFYKLILVKVAKQMVKQTHMYAITVK